ncbi:hypothetical protein Lal_00029350 [Lupinus albus]|nr:hypothetical protein Lal_00029350 [Lupinus albus]
MKVPNLSNRSIGSKNTHCAGPLYKQMIGSGVGGTTSAFYRFNQASATCRKWRQACCKHLHTLSFSSKDWPIYCDMTTTRLEILITQTIFQTSGLQALSILMEGVGEFSASTIIVWLMYTREILRQLFYNVKHKLEILDLAHNSIAGVKPNYQRFPCLKYLSLISQHWICIFWCLCPKIEALELVNPEIAMSDAQVMVKLSSSTLKRVYLQAISLEKLILEADVFELIGKGTLKHFKIDDVSVIHLDIGETIENLEIVDISNFTIIWPKFYQMTSRSSNLNKLRLWDVMFDDEDEVVDLETIATCFPHLSHLSLSYDVRDGVLHYGLQGSSQESWSFMGLFQRLRLMKNAKC